jgi:hypothetical protein
MDRYAWMWAGVVVFSLSAFAQDIADIAKTPSPGGAIPIPYPNVGGMDKSPLEKLGKGNPFWQHEMGDRAMTPCTHLKSAHAGGDPVLVPCVHVSLEHPGGHDTGKKAPCVHPKFGGVEHPGGDPIMAPCNHVKKEHPNGDDTGKRVPCVHKSAEHPQGDLGPFVPCVHPMKRLSEDKRWGVNWYTDDADIKRAIERIATRLHQWGVEASAQGAVSKMRPSEGFSAAVTAAGGDPRKLSVFNREPTAGYEADGSNPMWSHYNGAFHSLQIMKGTNQMPHVAYHEMGHAVCGHTCIQALSKGGQHSLFKETEPGTAVSEGWGDFVSMAMQFERTESSPKLYGYSIDDINKEKTPMSINAEARVAYILWDLFDTANESGDSVSLEFKELYKVFSPTLATFTEPPAIRDIDDYLERLIKNNPDQEKAIRAVKGKVLGVPNQRPANRFRIAR